MSTGRERNYLRRFVAVSKARDKREEKALDLFGESEAAERRAGHLRLVIQRQARKLKIVEPLNLQAFGERELQIIRTALSERIAHESVCAKLRRDSSGQRSAGNLS